LSTISFLIFPCGITYSMNETCLTEERHITVLAKTVTT
jgi:hypothetical protein